MKKIVLTIMLSALAMMAHADVTTNAAADANSVAGSVADNNSQTYSGAYVDNRDLSQTHGSDVSRGVGVAMAPNLATTLTETCMGSTSFGAGFSGGSFSFGTTWRDSACVRRLDARQMSAFGELPVAIEMMCDSELVREAAVRAGRPCVVDGGTARLMPASLPMAERQIVPSPEAAAAVVTETVRE